MATTAATVWPSGLTIVDAVHRCVGVAEHRSTHLILRCEQAGRLGPDSSWRAPQRALLVTRQLPRRGDRERLAAHVRAPEPELTVEVIDGGLLEDDDEVALMHARPTTATHV